MTASSTTKPSTSRHPNSQSLKPYSQFHHTGRQGNGPKFCSIGRGALLINDNKVVRTIAVSSGKPSTPTPEGFQNAGSVSATGC